VTALTRNKVLLGFGVTALALCLTGLLAYRGHAELARGAAGARRIGKASLSLEALQTDLKEADAQRCEYVRAGDPASRDQCRAALASARGRLGDLAGLADGGAPDPLLEEAGRRLDDRAAVLEESLRLRDAQRLNTRGQWALTGELRQADAALRRALEGVASEADRRLARHEEEARAAGRRGSFLVFALAGMALAGLALSGWQAGRDAAACRRAEERLARTEETLAGHADWRQRAEGQLQRLHKLGAVGQVAGGLIHDFNNLLAVIIGSGQLSLRVLSPADPARDLVGQVVRAGEQAASLTRQLLGLIRERRTPPGPLDLNAVVAEMERLLRVLLGQAVELATSLAPGLRAVLADRAQVEQVILNLVVNARDAMPGGGRVLIETANVEGGDAGQDPAVLLRVADTGCGIDEQTRRHLFEPFFTTKGEKGTGVGLATVEGIVRRHRGRIAVDSTPGRGTAVSVFWPQASAATPEAPRTVLFVGPDDETHGSLADALLRPGDTVLRAADLPEAVRLAGAHAGPIDLLVTDLTPAAPDVVAQLVVARPELRVLYLAEDGGQVPLDPEPGVACLPRRVTPEALGEQVRRLFAG
jgi:signal transduction histidine kinase